jgi:hypothetical protein
MSLRLGGLISAQAEQEEINAKVDLLQERGPILPRPHADRIESSRHSNMKELRGKVDERYLRVLFAFDPRSTALLLIGGDKTDDPTWYDKFVPIADNLFDDHLRELEQERKKALEQERKKKLEQKRKKKK